MEFQHPTLATEASFRRLSGRWSTANEGVYPSPVAARHRAKVLDEQLPTRTFLTYIHIHMYLYVYVYMYVCIYIHVSIPVSVSMSVSVPVPILS